MARPIKETPVLKGGDAVRFLKAAANPQKVDEQTKAKMRKNYDFFKSKERF